MAVRNIETFNEPRKAVIVARTPLDRVLRLRACFVTTLVCQLADRSRTSIPDAKISMVTVKFYLPRVHLFHDEMFNYLTIKKSSKYFLNSENSQ